MIDLIFRDDMSLKGFETDNPKTPLFLKNQRKRKYMSNDPSSPLKEFLSAEQALSKDPNLLPTDFRHGVHFQISVTHVFSFSLIFQK
jgi:hypothetical protein